MRDSRPLCDDTEKILALREFYFPLDRGSVDFSGLAEGGESETSAG
jgi:hypothetical protein